ncbi:hypothetical protein MRX96_035828 [Rhipicephalus microplus]
MKIARGYVSVVALEDYVYAIGGCNGRIYVSGGVNGQKVHASVEVYTPSQDTWCVAKRLPSPRCCHQMVVFDGRIYVIGGYNGRRRLQSVLCSGDGEEPLTWHQMNPIRSCRSSFATAIFNGNLYIIGGYDVPAFVVMVIPYDKETEGRALSQDAYAYVARLGSSRA